jgi:predicted ester cyclase
MSAQENKRVARLYHKLNPEEIDVILFPDFVGYHPDGSTWTRDDHRRTWSEEHNIKDTIHVQIAEGEWVATRFTRSGSYRGKHYEFDMMAFKRFQDGKIVEIWEQYDRKQLED